MGLPQAAQHRATAAQGIVLVAAGFLPALAIVSLAPAVPTIMDHFHAVPNAGLRVPLLVSAPGLAVALLAVFAGVLVDKFGRRPLLLGASLLYGVAGTAPLLLDNLNEIFVSRLFVGVAEAALLTIVNTLIADYWDHAGRRRWLVVQGVAGPIAATGTIWFAGYLTAAHWNAAFAIYAIAFLIAAGTAAFIYEPGRRAATHAVPETAAGPFPVQQVMLIGAVTLFVATLYFVFIIQGGLAFREVGVNDPRSAGNYISLGSVAVPVGALIFGAVGRAKPLLHVALVLGMLGVGLTGIGLAPDRYWMLGMLIIQQAGAGMAVPALIFWAQTRLHFAHRGRGMGVWASCFFFGQFSSPFFVDIAKHASGSVQGAFVAAGCAGLAGAAVAAVAALSTRPAHEASADVEKVAH